MADILLFGLGNPGPEHEKTYHNAGLSTLMDAGAMVIERIEGILESRGQLSEKEHCVKNFCYQKYNGPVNLILARVSPEKAIYMNQSGLAVKEALEYFRVSPDNLYILHDDSDLFIGEYKLEKSRGAAGHHGVESVIESVGTNGFWRGRIGIRPKDEVRRQKAGEFVLKTVSREDRDALGKVARRLAVEIAAAVELK